MKKKILLIISNMESGGVSKSMSSLLNVIDTLRYDVDCFILSPKGIFMDSIPQEINMVSDKRTALFFSEFPKNILSLIKSGYVVDAIFRLIAGFLMLFNKGLGGWMLSRRIYKIKKEYDLAVDYNGQHQLYYLIDKVQAKKKVTFFHSDYEKWDYYYSMDKKYMPKADYIFSISKHCVDSLIKYFSSEKEKIGLFENISSVKTILKMSTELVDDPLDNKVKTLITIGHLTENKGTSLAIKAARILKEKGLVFKWYFIGNDSQKEYYTRLAKEEGVLEQIVFMGLKFNPYPYIKQADILVHPSKFEGKSIALDEAKLLCKPIVVTNFSTVHDQFIDRVNASICEMKPQDIAAKIIELIDDEYLRNNYTQYLYVNMKDNSSEIDKLYDIINIDE